MAQPSTIFFTESGFPAADTGAFSTEALRAQLEGVRSADADRLPEVLAQPATRLLIMPYGSAYPEQDWPAILHFLERGGNLVVLGGKPFTRPAYRNGRRWELRPPSVAASHELFIDDYQETPGSTSLAFEQNPDVSVDISPFAWKRAFSPVLRLSVSRRQPVDEGSNGTQDAFLTTLAWGTRDGHRFAAPVVMIDRVAQRFVGGRWIFLACDADPASIEGDRLMANLQKLALRQNDRFTFRPRFAVFVPGESLEFELKLARDGHPESGDQLKLRVSADDQTPREFSFPAVPGKIITLPQSASKGRGLHTVQATLLRRGQPLWTYRTGFWLRDLAWLNSGPRLTVDSDYFQLDGKPLPVVGTTYMASDVHRWFLYEPNPSAWDKDMGSIRAAGLNMLRTGIWTSWDLLLNPDKSASEHTLRSIEAFLMTARKYGLPVQFNLFAFAPDLTRKGHPYLAQGAEQDRYVSSLASRFHEVPFLAWDLINEPSPNRNFWQTSPSPDEAAAWRAWLLQQYPDQQALLPAWADTGPGAAAPGSDSLNASAKNGSADPFALPEPAAFGPDAVRAGHNPLKVYDYFLFTQSFFRDWVRHQTETIRGTGSNQLITVGQDEGGVSGRLSPAFYSPDISFTATHTWWDFDSVLWASLSAKMPGQPMLIQEMGEQRRLTQNGHLRLSAEEESWQLSRKLAISFAQGAGGIEWVWNVNAMMAIGDEVSIGAIRPDGTEKPEAQVLAGLAQFASSHPELFSPIEPPSVTLVTSQAQQYTGMWDMVIAMQKKAVRAMAYYNHQPLRILPENRVGELGKPRLVILPSAQALGEDAWQKLLGYVEAGGTLVVTGPVDRDEHWQPVDRMAPLHISAQLAPLDVRQSVLALPGNDRTVSVSFPSEVQTGPVSLMRFADGSSIQIVRHGNGQILWAAEPLEFSDGFDAPAALYRFAMEKSGVTAPFAQLRPLSPGVLAFPTVMRDAVLYSFSSESFEDEPIDIQDSITHARLHYTLPAQHGALVLIRRSDGAVVASYGVQR
ncbi:cellulase family glycosylhydrolase [Occallatibacter riparius]|uniref:Cellulase family glycosylhydrolase n=1 Tax=Occallatibacter riparius TaxID=1002689 RepID=A0A9J7BTA8_9BACT|nr:cellulase family glycosylhydrolase [Occallatibacter riparius]UWZ85825.1 cellulase family glycosylhydrolase [Occallatibacter riparius]